MRILGRLQGGACHFTAKQSDDAREFRFDRRQRHAGMALQRIHLEASHASLDVGMSGSLVFRAPWSGVGAPVLSTGYSES